MPDENRLTGRQQMLNSLIQASKGESTPANPEAVAASNQLIRGPQEEPENKLTGEKAKKVEAQKESEYKRVKPTPEHPFYSRLHEVLHATKNMPKQADPATWKQWLDGAQRRGEVSKEEREDTGVDKYLDSAGGQVHRDDVRKFVAGNVPKVKVETPKGGSDEHAFQELIDTEHENFIRGEDFSFIEDLHGDERLSDRELKKLQTSREAREKFLDKNIDEFEDYIRQVYPNEAEAAQRGEGEGGEGNRYSEYQLPGGKNYGERVLTLPAKNPELAVSASDTDAGETSRSVHGKDSGDYNSPHWDEPNVLAHFRFNERPVNGKPSFHVEEVQSDWHEQGRKKGYHSDNKVVESKPGQWKIVLADGPQSGFWPSQEEAEQHLRSYQESNKKFEVPDAPHKKSWPLLTMKAAIAEAVHKGLTRVSWTPGDEQNRRYGGRGHDEEAGMRVFYDAMLPSMVNDFIRKHGSKVEKGETHIQIGSKTSGVHPHEERPKNVGDGRSISTHYFDITPQLKKAVEEGLPSH